MNPPADLVRAAQRAFANAYAPYSKFRVGAALRAASGAIYAGANVENSSFGLTRCAEQSAVQAMVSAGERSFSQIVIYSAATPPAAPCGGCRQVLFEFAPEAQVFLLGADGALVVTSVGELLPLGFRLS